MTGPDYNYIIFFVISRHGEEFIFTAETTEIAEDLFLFCFPLSPANTNGIKGRKPKTCIPVG
jgi:hypothetical protein